MPHSHPVALLQGLCNQNRMGLTELVTFKAVSKALTFLLSSIKVCVHVSSSEIFSVGLTISLNLSNVNPSPLAEKARLYIWQAVQLTIRGEEAITHRDRGNVPTCYCCLMNLWKVEQEGKESE